VTEQRKRPPRPCGPTLRDCLPAEYQNLIAFDLEQRQRALDALDATQAALQAAAVRTSEPEAFLDRHQLAHRWRCSRDTVDRLLRRESDALHVIEVGGKPLVRRDHLERWEDHDAPAAFMRRR